MGALSSILSFSSSTTDTPTHWTAITLPQTRPQKRTRCFWVRRGTGPGRGAVLKNRVKSSWRNGRKNIQWDCIVKKWRTSPQKAGYFIVIKFLLTINLQKRWCADFLSLIMGFLQVGGLVSGWFVKWPPSGKDLKEGLGLLFHIEAFLQHRLLAILW